LQIGGSSAAALEQATQIASATGQQVVVWLGNAIPLASNSVDKVIMNNVPIGIGSTYYGPMIDPEEVLRILAPGGSAVGDAVQDFYDEISIEF